MIALHYFAIYYHIFVRWLNTVFYFILIVFLQLCFMLYCSLNCYVSFIKEIYLRYVYTMCVVFVQLEIALA